MPARPDSLDSTGVPTLVTRDSAARRAGAERSPALPARRRFLLGSGMAVLAGALPACGGGSDAAESAHTFTVQVDTTQVGAGLNSDLLGHNVQWTNLGDGMVDSSGAPSATMNTALAGLAPTMLRFPGGEQSDVYHWERAIGSQETRTENQHAQTLGLESSVMGTAEFLDLCLRTGAQPVLTVNVPSGTAAEAAAWVKAVNITGMVSPTSGDKLPGVLYWEIGNEPYLDSSTLPSLAMSATDYATKASAIITAMRAVDPSIQIGVPLSTDQRNGVVSVRELSWTYTVLDKLGQLGQTFNFATVHNGYLPLAYDKLGDRNAVYWATMAGSRSVLKNLDELQTIIRDNWGGEKIPLALTEYHAIFSIDTGASDAWTGSPLGALYVADLLRALAADRDDVMFANLWSLSENDRFGAIHADGWLRPVGQVMQLMRPLLTGSRLAASATCETVSTVAAGVVEATTGLPLIEVLSSVTTGDTTQTARVLMLQRHPDREGQGTVELAGWNGAANVSATLKRLHTTDPFRSDDVEGLFTSDTLTLSTTDTGSALRCSVTLPASCLAVLEITRTL